MNLIKYLTFAVLVLSSFQLFALEEKVTPPKCNVIASDLRCRLYSSWKNGDSLEDVVHREFSKKVHCPRWCNKGPRGKKCRRQQKLNCL